MAIEYVLKDDDDGAIIGGASTSKIGFFGLATPVVRSTIGNAALGTAYSTYSFSGYGFSTSAAMRAALLLLDELRGLFVYYGLGA